ncbi:ParB/RepB/Spo0J family partition protein [Streptomyces sp. B27]|uniref:ParB/RepB/Spo0J family partition protein n=1 Tax=Streptomyces sp. B27 TaxID=2485015 RepID=UPI000FDA52A2|nr:ParB/RepB/Spo0J family partition protein [Streptomyces sp. B27]
MSVADKVGQSSSIGRRRSQRGRAKAVTEGAIPAYELIRLDLAGVSPTPLNPRRNFGTDQEKTAFGEELRQVQLSACVVVTRAAYLALWPNHDNIVKGEHVLLNGERRYRSALHVGLEQLDFVVRDDLASSRADFMDRLLAENLEREDFDVIERARGVQQLVAVCAEEEARGARSRAAARLSRDRSWVTNQLALLTLPEEIQAQLSSAEISERDGRTLARHLKEHPGLGAEALREFLSSTKETADQQRQEQQQLIEAGRRALQQRREAGLLSADNKPSVPDAAAGQTGGLLSADNKPSAPDAGVQEAPTPEPETGSLLSADNKLPRASVSVGSSAPSPALPGQPSGRDPEMAPAEPEQPDDDQRITTLIALERYVMDAAEFAANVEVLSDLHREAREADAALADNLINAMRDHLTTALEALPIVAKTT